MKNKIKDRLVTAILAVIALSAWLYLIGHYADVVMKKTNDDLYHWKLSWADRMYH